PRMPAEPASTAAVFRSLTMLMSCHMCRFVIDRRIGDEIDRRQSLSYLPVTLSGSLMRLSRHRSCYCGDRVPSVVASAGSRLRPTDALVLHPLWWGRRIWKRRVSRVRLVRSNKGCLCRVYLAEGGKG